MVPGAVRGQLQLQGIVVELMQANADFEAEYQRCSKEAATWDGSNPYG